MSKWGHAIRAAAFGVAVSACAAATEGFAADMPLFGGDPTPQTKVEFGTGWYIRGDAGGVFEKGLLPSSVFSGSDPTKINWSATLGSGYKFNNWFRADATLGMFGQQNNTQAQGSVNCFSSINNVVNAVGQSVGVYAVPGQCTPVQQLNLQKYLTLINGYFDLGTWYGVTPYIGAGVGAAIIHESGTLAYFNNSDGSPYRANLVLPVGVNSNPTFLQGPALINPLVPQPVINYGNQNWDRSVKLTKYNFAWALMAGFGYNLTDSATIDIGYRYVNMGQFTDITGISRNLSAQEIHIGIRYLVDGML
jgi:opacity protein-like surface antigen